MKITSINAQNVLGIVGASVAITTPVTLFCGQNHSGKTSLAEVCRMALGGDIQARGVALKKDLQALVHDDAKSGSVEVELDDGKTLFALLPSNKSTTQDVYVPHKALPFVLEPERFAALTPNERRAVLFGVMGVQVTPKIIIAKLTERGVDATKAERVGPLLKAGIDAACAEAKRKGTEAKGAWRAVTGETYGAVKAVDWTAPAPKVDTAASKTLTTELQHADVAIDQWQQTIGKLAGQEQRRAALQAKLPGLLELAGKAQRIQNKLTADESGLAEWEQRLVATTAEAGQGQRVGLVHDLAAALHGLLDAGEPCLIQPGDDPKIDAANQALNDYEEQHGSIGVAGNPEAQAKLPEIKRSRDLMASAVVNGKRDLDTAKAAKTEADTITAELAEPFDAAGLANTRTEVDKLKASRAETVKKLDVIKAQATAAAAAEKTTKDAAEHHADVVAWDKIAEALAPDGIPGEMLAAAMQPFNDRLAQSAIDTDWARIEIDADMNIMGALHERPYKLLSESEKWRADAMLAEAISHLSGLKLLLLDRFDVLGLGGRQEALAWLDTLAETGEIDTALVFATLKSIPAGLPATISAHWIAGGVVGQLQEAA